VADARKERIDERAALALAKSMKRVLAARGSAIVALDPGKSSPAEIASAIVGPSGNLRAPALKVGGTLVVGFNEELYDRVFG
jgi:hypothetical protein